jgi:hypothetical protein
LKVIKTSEGVGRVGELIGKASGQLKLQIERESSSGQHAGNVF